jgi:cysteine desulfurase/selenocysteine lyase
MNDLSNRPASFDVAKARADFPILSKEVYGKPLVFLDSGASAQKPQAVIDAMTYVMREEYANVHRGVHYLSQHTTMAYEAVRGKIATHINAGDENEVVFTRGATEAINLVAASWGRKNLREGDEVIVSEMEHHSNIVPWQMLRDELGIVLKVAPINDDGIFLLDAFEALLSDRTKLVAITHVSNVLGTVVPIKDVAALAHAKGALVLIDGCQGVVHLNIDVQDSDVDFYAFSSHKLYGPTAFGVLYGKKSILADMPPYQGGGDMIASVSFEKTVYAEPPHRFEAGTPPIIEAIGFGAALDYVNSWGMDQIIAHEEEVHRYAQDRLKQLPGITVYGNAPDKQGIVSFLADGIHAHDVGTIVDRCGVAVRVGHHCAEPLMQRFGVEAMARASFGMYNTKEDVDALLEAVKTAQEFFG